MNRSIAALAREQKGLFTLAQAVAAGLTRREAQCCLEAGAWERVHAGVYRIAGAPVSWEQQVLAACLAGGADSVASHRSAAYLWQLDGIPARPIPIELTVRNPRYHRRHDVVVHRSTDIGPSASTWRVAIEVDGYESHSSLAAFNRDRARQNDLVTAGWTVLRFTWSDVVHRPEIMATSLRRVLCANSNAGG